MIGWVILMVNLKEFFDYKTRYKKLSKKYNTVLLKYEALKENVSDKCFDVIYEQISDLSLVKPLKEENKRLRIKNKNYKEEIKRYESKFNKKKKKVR